MIHRARPGFTYHIVPEIQRRPVEALRLFEPLIRDGYWKTLQFPPTEDLDAARRVGAALRLAGIEPTFDIGGTVSDGELNLQSPDKAVRAAALKRAKRLVDEAYALGARIADFNPGPDPGLDRREAELGFLADSLMDLCTYASDTAPDGRTLTISIEHFDRDLDKRRILGPTEESAAFLRRLRRGVSNIGMTMDLSHLLLLGEEPGAATRAAGELVTNAHLSNCILASRSDPRWGDRHPPFFVSGGAVTETTIASFLRGLEAIGYFNGGEASAGRLTFQVKPGPAEESAVVVAGCRRALEGAIARLDEEATS